MYMQNTRPQFCYLFREVVPARTWPNSFVYSDLNKMLHLSHTRMRFHTRNFLDKAHITCRTIKVYVHTPHMRFNAIWASANFTFMLAWQHRQNHCETQMCMRTVLMRQRSACVEHSEFYRELSRTGTNSGVINFKHHNFFPSFITLILHSVRREYAHASLTHLSCVYVCVSRKYSRAFAAYSSGWPWPRIRTRCVSVCELNERWSIASVSVYVLT